MRIFAITLFVEDYGKNFYIDELYKDAEYRWNEPDYEEKPSETSPIYFIRVRRAELGDDSSFKFKDSHLRFMTTIEKVRKKYGGKDGVTIHF